jgi:hypothetical protein
MDWVTHPAPFCRCEGAARVNLEFLPAGPEPRDEPAFAPGRLAPAALGRPSIF